jgi:hypothetical protein
VPLERRSTGLMRARASLDRARNSAGGARWRGSPTPPLLEARLRDQPAGENWCDRHRHITASGAGTPGARHAVGRVAPGPGDALFARASRRQPASTAGGASAGRTSRADLKLRVIAVISSQRHDDRFHHAGYRCRRLLAARRRRAAGLPRLPELSRWRVPASSLCVT